MKACGALQENNFFRVKELNNEEQEILKNKFNTLGFSALNFTDSRSIYQFYPLKRLWDDIQIALKNEFSLFKKSSCSRDSISQSIKHSTSAYSFRIVATIFWELDADDSSNSR